MNPLIQSGLARSLAASSLLKSDELRHHLEQAAAQQQVFTTYLVEQRLLSSQTLMAFCQQHYGLSAFDLEHFELNDIPSQYLVPKLIHKHHALPLFLQGNTLYIALADPTNLLALDEFSFNLGLHTEMQLVSEEALSQAIQKVTQSEQQALALDDSDDASISNLEVTEDRSDNDDTVSGREDDAPIVKYINKMLLDAIRQGASDLHFEPYEHLYRIRFRIDGILHEHSTPPIKLASRLAARLKVMARLDIAERRLPQDGRIKLKIAADKTIDMRVNTLPTLWGEKVVIRLLDSSSSRLNIELLGFDERQQALYLKALAKPQGMILVTGPTGSGKTVTLYTGLHILNTQEVNISTAEDPVEINLPGINQVQVNPKAGLTFASALRAFLRQDPDVVMVGEIRDLETAEIAIKAAQTGHLVLSTLHTNSAAETLTRMLNMGVPAFNIASSVTLIMAQRLARKLCPHCKAPEEIPMAELLSQGFTPAQLQEPLVLYKPVGCPQCSCGYKGRVGLYEMLVMSETIAQLIMEGANSLTIALAAEQEGMQRLRQSGLLKAAAGLTSLAEINRVTSH